MRTVDSRRMRAPATSVFAAAADVARWPEILPHYRWVRVLEAPEEGGAEGKHALVEMAAWRPFGLFKYPTWWVSHMTADELAGEIRYHHVRGITRGMDVVWTIDPVDERETMVSIVHEWTGPAWPLIRRPAAEWVIGPVFIHSIASRTLAGIARHVEAHT